MEKNTNTGASTQYAVLAPPANYNMAEMAVYYAASGWPVFPAPLGSKRSHKSEKHSGEKWGATTDPEEIRADWSRWPTANIGIPTGLAAKIFVLDADTLAGHGKNGTKTLARWETASGKIHTVEARTPTGGRHLYFRFPFFEVRNSESKLALGIDIRGEGGMVLGPPSVKPDVGAYEWIKAPWEVEPADCPHWLLDKLADFENNRLSNRAAVHIPSGFEPAGSDEAEELLSYIPPDCGYGDWLAVLMALHDKFGGSDEGLSLADRWSASGSLYKPGEVAAKWRSFKAGGGTSWATIPALAKQAGADLSAISRNYRQQDIAQSGAADNPETPGRRMARGKTRRGF